LVLHKNSTNGLLIGGVVSRDAQKLTSGARLLTSQFLIQHLAAGPGEEGAGHVGVDDVRERVALFGKAPDIVPEGLAELLLAALEVPRVARANVSALEVSDEKLPEVGPAAIRVSRQELEPGTNIVPQADWEILDDE
jgi:hypothetical protein